jgi:predicted acylesterase/phospholipase RssA
MKIVYTLSGGAAYGYAHVGVLKYLEEQGLRPEGIAGTSMGAIVGGLYACGFRAVQIEQIAEQVRSIELLRLFFPSFPRGGIIDTDGIRDFFQGFVKDRKIEDLPVAYRAVAVDVETGSEVVFDRGPLIDGMIASMSIPGVFKPYWYHGRELVDGGVVNNLPWDVAEELGDTHVVVNVAPRRGYTEHGRVFSSEILREVESNKKTPRSEEKKELSSGEEKNSGINEAFREHLFKLIEGIKKRENAIPFKDMVSSMNRSQGKKGEHSSLPEIISKMMAIIHTGTKMPSRAQMKNMLYLHPDVRKFNLNDFHKAEEIIRIGYETARGDADFQKKLEKLLKKKHSAEISPIEGRILSEFSGS